MTNEQLADPQPLPITGRAPTAEEKFYCAMGETLVKDALSFLNQTLRQMATLNAAILAGAIAFYDKGIAHKPLLAVAILLLIGSLVCGVLGMYPREDVINRHAPYEIRDLVHATIRRKRHLLWGATIPLVLALATVAVGVIVKHLGA